MTSINTAMTHFCYITEYLLTDIIRDPCLIQQEPVSTCCRMDFFPLPVSQSRSILAYQGTLPTSITACNQMTKPENNLFRQLWKAQEPLASAEAK